MIGQQIPPEREAWEHDQIEDMRQRMEFWRRVRAMADEAFFVAVVLIAAIVAIALIVFVS
jgi:hypothetical protein